MNLFIPTENIQHHTSDCKHHEETTAHRDDVRTGSGVHKIILAGTSPFHSTRQRRASSRGNDTCPVQRIAAHGPTQELTKGESHEKAAVQTSSSFGTQGNQNAGHEVDSLRRLALALWAVPVAAGIIGDLLSRAGLAMQYVPTQCG